MDNRKKMIAKALGVSVMTLHRRRKMRERQPPSVLPNL
jgi:hypothetical protein